MAASLPALWWEPLHVDEAITLQFAPGGPAAILNDIFVERGGAPIFFLVEHLSLRWPGGVVGLRLPVFLFFLAAILLSSLVAGRLRGAGPALVVPILLAVAPLAVRLSTFARMYTLFLASLLLVVLLLLRAVRDGARAHWIGAGLLAGALAYIHPIAPLYIIVAFATAFLYSGLPARPFLRTAWPCLVATAAIGLPYVYALAVLSHKYGVGSSESTVFGGASDYPVPVEGLRALTATDWLLTGVLATLAIAGAVAVFGEAPRIALALMLWLAIPITFFSLVPSEAFFYPRYLLPALPFFLVLVAEGCFAAGRLVRRPLLCTGAIVSALVLWEGLDAASRQERLRQLGVTQTVDTVGGVEHPVIFSSVGASLAGRPALLLDAYAALELSNAIHVEELPSADPAYVPDIAERGAGELRRFLAGPQSPGRGVWLFSGSPRRIARAEERLQLLDDVAVLRPSHRILLVRSRVALEPDSLVRQSAAVRTAWLGPEGHDRWPRLLIDLERAAVSAD